MKRRVGGYYLHLFEDGVLRLEEGTINREKLRQALKRAGRILIIPDIDKDGREVFMMYKERGNVENQFTSSKKPDLAVSSRPWIYWRSFQRFSLYPDR